MITASKFKTFSGYRYTLSIGGHGRKFTKRQANIHATKARDASMKARVVSLGKNKGFAVYTRK